MNHFRTRQAQTVLSSFVRKEGNPLLIQFLVYGALGWIIEVVWTGLGSLLPPVDWNLTGKTYLWMFPIYGGGALLLQPLIALLGERHWVLRGLVWMVAIFVLEYSTGFTLKALTGSCPWDYSAARLSFHGFIRWDYAPAWFVLGLTFERISPVVTALIKR